MPQLADEEAMTVSVTVLLFEPPLPVQLSVYEYTPGVLIAFNTAPVLETGWLPLQPSVPVPPLAVQDVAFEDVHASVGACPGWICAVLPPLMVTATVGWPTTTAFTVTVAVLGVLWPPGPLHTRV